MNDKELHNIDKNQESVKLDWEFCPICGHNLPKLQNLKFCTNCGANIKYIKEHKKLPTTPSQNPYKSQVIYPQYQPPSIYYGPPKISDEELINNKEHKLWGSLISIGLPFGTFLLWNIVLGGFLAFLTFFTLDTDQFKELMTNSYFISMISISELIFILIPVIYVRKYLKNPTFKNSLVLLGFTSRNYDRRKILKEILIGLSFAIIGILLVTIVSIFIEFILEMILRIEIVQDSSEFTGVILPTDIPSLIVFSISMIIIIGPSEEILFRGFMQKGLTRSLGNKWGIIITALLFSMIHLIGILSFALESPFLFIISFLLSFFPYFAISLMLGFLYQWRKENLIAVCLTHGVYNTLTIILAYIFYIAF
ncbi:MAG: CPBP family intramembrane glutamic endopeptidase [Candidatus Thorarchaeota archaeon]